MKGFFIIKVLNTKLLRSTPDENITNAVYGVESPC